MAASQVVEFTTQEFVTASEGAKLFNVTGARIRKLAEEGELTAYRVGDSPKPSFKISDLQRAFRPRPIDPDFFEKKRLRDAARMAVARAVRNGQLQRQNCEVCGRWGESHHDDYSKPLVVRWLCSVHHAEAHERGQQ